MRTIILLVILFMFLSVSKGFCGSIVGQLIPEFGDSISFEKNEPPMEIADLKGKGILLVFFEWVG